MFRKARPAAHANVPTLIMLRIEPLAQWTRLRAHTCDLVAELGRELAERRERARADGRAAGAVVADVQGREQQAAVAAAARGGGHAPADPAHQVRPHEVAAKLLRLAVRYEWHRTVYPAVSAVYAANDQPALARDTQPPSVATVCCGPHRSVPHPHALLCTVASYTGPPLG